MRCSPPVRVCCCRFGISRFVRVSGAEHFRRDTSLRSRRLLPSPLPPVETSRDGSGKHAGFGKRLARNSCDRIGGKRSIDCGRGDVASSQPPPREFRPEFAFGIPGKSLERTIAALHVRTEPHLDRFGVPAFARTTGHFARTRTRTPNV